MLVCTSCREVIDEGEFETRHGEDLEHFGIPCSEEFDVCPYCGEEEFAETFICDLCEEYVTGRYVELANDTIACENCFNLKDVCGF